MLSASMFALIAAAPGFTPSVRHRPAAVRRAALPRFAPALAVETNKTVDVEQQAQAISDGISSVVDTVGAMFALFEESQAAKRKAEAEAKEAARVRAEAEKELAEASRFNLIIQS